MPWLFVVDGVRSVCGRFVAALGFAVFFSVFAPAGFAKTGGQAVAANPTTAVEEHAYAQDRALAKGSASSVAGETAAGTSVATAATINAPATVQPEMAADLWQQPYMFPWGPGRDRLASRGVSFNFSYAIDALDDVQRPEGTRQDFGGWGRIRGTVVVDFSKFSRAKGLTYYATSVWQYGQNMGNVIGSIVDPSGLASIHTFRLDSMWFEQSLFDGKLFLKAGQFAAQDYYGFQEYGNNFIIEALNYAFGNLGNVRASWDPASGPAGEIRVVPTKRFYVKSGVFSPENYSSTGSDYHKTDNHGLDSSATWDSEIGFHTDPDAPATRKSYSGIVKAGAVYNGGKFLDYRKNADVTGNYTIYVQVAQPVYRMEPGRNRGLDLRPA